MFARGHHKLLKENCLQVNVRVSIFICNKLDYARGIEWGIEENIKIVVMYIESLYYQRLEMNTDHFKEFYWILEKVYESFIIDKMFVTNLLF